MASGEHLRKWFRDEVSDLSLAERAFGILERHFPEAAADYRHERKHCDKWSYACWEIGRSLRLRLPDRKRAGSFRKVLAELSEFCGNDFARLLYELSEYGPLTDGVLGLLPAGAHLPAVQQQLAELHRLKQLEEEALRRMDQMGY